MDYQIRTTKDLAGAIRHLRQNAELTQVALAERAGVSSKWISDVESGKSSLRFTTVLRLLDALDVDLTLQPRDAPSLDLDELLGLKSPQ